MLQEQILKVHSNVFKYLGYIHSEIGTCLMSPRRYFDSLVHKINTK
jgi:hypothetical protein